MADVLYDLTPLETESRFRGIGYYARTLARAIDALSPSERRGLSISALVALDGSRAAAEGSLQWGGSPEVPFKTGMRWIWARRLRLPGTLRKAKPGLFHVTESLGTPRLTGVPRVVTCHDILRLVMHEQYLEGGPVYRRLFKAAEASRYRTAARVIAISKATADDLVRELAVPASRIDIIPHGVDHDRFRPARDEDEARARAATRNALLGEGHAPYVLYVGGADPRKNVDVLVRAFARAKLEGVSLVLAGKLHHTEEAFVRDAISAAGARQSVRMLGFVPDDALVPLLSGALVLAFPSSYEGFGLPVLEAMATGVPVVTTTVSSLGEVAGDACCVVPPEDEGALADALSQVTKSARLRDDLRARGLARAATFSWKTTALATVDCYARALGR